MRITVRIDGINYTSKDEDGDADERAEWFRDNIGDISSLRIKMEDGRHVIFCEELLKRAIIAVED